MFRIKGVNMIPQTVVKECADKLASALKHYQEQLKTLRSGRASAVMLDGVFVEVYGTQMPLNQVATVTAPEAQLLQITPFDPNSLQAIVSAIRDNPSLGLNPSDDGRVVRVPIPALNEERRREIAKQLGSKQEEALIVVRSVRREAMDVIDEAKKAKELGEDEAKRLSGQVEDAVKKVHSEIEAATKHKESEIMKV